MQLKKPLLAIIVSLFSLLVADRSFAEIRDIAGRQYTMTGNLVAKGELICDGVSYTGTPIVAANTFDIVFGASDDTGGTFQMKNDSVAPKGTVFDGDIFKRKGNKLVLKYASAATPEEAAGQLVQLVQEKAKKIGSQFGDIPFTIKNYSFVGKARPNQLYITEKLYMTGPYKGCTAKFRMYRKLKGFQSI